MMNMDLDKCINLVRNPSKLDSRSKVFIQNFRTLNKESILHYCAIENDINLVKLAHNCGVNVDCVNKYSRTALMESASLGYVDMVKLLIELGADISQIDTEGNTPLHLAYINKVPKEVIDMLLELGSDPNQTNNYGEIPEKAL